MKTRNHLNVAPPPREHEMAVGAESVTLQIPAGAVTLTGDLEIPENAHGLVLFAHGSGSKVARLAASWFRKHRRPRK